MPWEKSFSFAELDSSVQFWQLSALVYYNRFFFSMYIIAVGAREINNRYLS